MEMRYKARNTTDKWIAWLEQFHQEQTPFSERQAAVQSLTSSLEEFERMLNSKEIELEEYREETTREYYRKLEAFEEAKDGENLETLEQKGL